MHATLPGIHPTSSPSPYPRSFGGVACHCGDSPDTLLSTLARPSLVKAPFLLNPSLLTLCPEELNVAWEKCLKILLVVGRLCQHMSQLGSLSHLPDGGSIPALSPLGSDAPSTSLSAEDLVCIEKMEVIYREVAQTFITKLSPCNYRLRASFVIHASNPTRNSGQNSRSFMLSSSAYSPHSFQRFRSVNRHDSTFKLYADIHPSPPSALCPIHAPLRPLEPLSST